MLATTAHEASRPSHITLHMPHQRDHACFGGLATWGNDRGSRASWLLTTSSSMLAPLTSSLTSMIHLARDDTRWVPAKRALCGRCGFHHHRTPGCAKKKPKLEIGPAPLWDTIHQALRYVIADTNRFITQTLIEHKFAYLLAHWEANILNSRRPKPRTIALRYLKCKRAILAREGNQEDRHRALFNSPFP